MIVGNAEVIKRYREIHDLEAKLDKLKPATKFTTAGVNFSFLVSIINIYYDYSAVIFTTITISLVCITVMTINMLISRRLYKKIFKLFDEINALLAVDIDEKIIKFIVKINEIPPSEPPSSSEK